MRNVNAKAPDKKEFNVMGKKPGEDSASSDVDDEPLSSFSSYEENEAYQVKIDIKDESLSDKVYSYLLYLWDGPTFFGMTTSKLNRVKGEKVTFMTKCLSVEWCISTIILVSISIYVIVNEGSKLGTQKSQTVDLVNFQNLEISYEKALPLVHGTLFFVDELLPRLRQYQEFTKDDPKAIKMLNGPDKRLKESFKDFDYFDWQFTEAFLCERVKMSMQTIRLVDQVGITPYKKTVTFNFGCQILPFSNDKVRILHMTPMNDPSYAGVYTNDSPEGQGEQSRSFESRRKVDFATTVDYRALVSVDFAVDAFLKDLETFSWLFHSKERASKPEKYNGWNFTNPIIWDSTSVDSFWWNENTQNLYRTVNYKLGQQ